MMVHRSMSMSVHRHVNVSTDSRVDVHNKLRPRRSKLVRAYWKAAPWIAMSADVDFASTNHENPVLSLNRKLGLSVYE